MTDVVKFDISDYVATITINRPEAMNSMNPEVRLGLSQALDEVEQNSSIFSRLLNTSTDIDIPKNINTIFLNYILVINM